MLRPILIFGVIAGVIAGAALSAETVLMSHSQGGSYGMLVGYLSMLVALSAVFIAIKRYRDQALGGVIRFWPALAVGLGVSFVAGLFYVTAWELTQAMMHMDYGAGYAKAMVAEQQAKGVTGAALAKVMAEAEAFRVQYANPLYRWPMTFIEIFPVGVIVSLISAALLRNSRFLPARG